MSGFSLETGESQNEVKTLKKKLKILKDAILKERDIIKNQDERIKELSKKNELLEKEMDNKEEDRVRLGKEIQKLQDMVISERSRSA